MKVKQLLTTAVFKRWKKPEMNKESHALKIVSERGDDLTQHLGRSDKEVLNRGGCCMNRVWKALLAISNCNCLSVAVTWAEEA